MRPCILSRFFCIGVPEPNVLTVAETARQKGCTRQAVYNALDRGDLTEVKMGAQRLVAWDDAFRRYEVKETGGRLHESYRKNQEVKK